jgi:hypothetical protein
MISQSAQKVIIFDSSSIINFTMNGLLKEFCELRAMFNGKFIVPQEVKMEIIDKPLEIKKFKLEALKIKELLTGKVIELPDSLGINQNTLTSKTEELMKIANNTFSGTQSPIHIIDSGETACLALSQILNEKGIKNVICVDERTLRLLGEKPENLLEILNRKLHTQIKANKDNFKFFKGLKFIRSAELIFVAYKKGIITLQNHNVLDALLYALKFNGCSISDEEIAEMERL